MPEAKSPSKSKASATKPKKAKPSSPTLPAMILEAVGELNEKRGSSRQAILKYINTNYDVDASDVAKRISRFIMIHVEKGELKQSRGTGAAGSFKLGVDHNNETKKVKKSPKPKTQAKSKDASSASKIKKTAAAKAIREAKPKTVKAKK